MNSKQLALLSLLLFFVVIFYTVIKPDFSELLRSQTPWVVPSGWTEIANPTYIQNWFVASLGMNLVSIILMLIFITQKYSSKRPSNDQPISIPKYMFLHIFFLGMLGLGNFAFLFWLKYDVSYLSILLTSIIFLSFSISDAVGLKIDRTDQQFRLPFFSIDIPSFLVALFFLIYALFTKVSGDFMSGISAAILILGNIMFVSVYLFLIDDKKKEDRMSQGRNALLIALFAALNIGIGFLIQLLRLPIYLDSIGTILAAVLMGPVYGVITGVVGLVVLSFITAPTALAYSITAAGIAIFASYFVRYGYLKKVLPTIVFGLLIGVIAAIVSAPITTYLFGGISFAGADSATAFFKAWGNTLATSVIMGGLTTDPVDKVITSILCFILVRGLSNRAKDLFPGSRLFK